MHQRSGRRGERGERAKLSVIGVGRAYGAGTMFEWYWATTFGGTLDRSVAC